MTVKVRCEFQRKWRDHVERMSLKRLPWQAYFYHPAGRRGIELSERKWTQFKVLFIIILSGVRLSLLELRPLLAYCTSPG
jgi:hypothetical protein